jgi:hypothetical protein
VTMAFTMTIPPCFTLDELVIKSQNEPNSTAALKAPQARRANHKE